MHERPDETSRRNGQALMGAAGAARRLNYTMLKPCKAGKRPLHERRFGISGKPGQAQRNAIGHPRIVIGDPEMARPGVLGLAVARRADPVLRPNLPAAS